MGGQDGGHTEMQQAPDDKPFLVSGGYAGSKGGQAGSGHLILKHNHVTQSSSCSMTDG
jgi:hypothetical protein